MLKLRDDAIAWKETDGEVLLLDLASSTYLAVNPSATVLWRLLANGTTQDELVDALVGAFDVDRDTATTDVADFLDDCRRRQLVDEHDAGRA